MKYFLLKGQLRWNSVAMVTVINCSLDTVVDEMKRKCCCISMAKALAGLCIQQQQSQQCAGCGKQRSMQQELCRQRSKAAVISCPALFAADGVEAVGKAIILCVDGQHKWAAAIARSNHSICGINDGACALQAKTVQRRLQWEHCDVGHEAAQPCRRQLREVGVQWVGCVLGALSAALVQPQCCSLHGCSDGVSQDSVQSCRK